MNKAVFFDRDGVVNRERNDYTWRIQDFVINDGVVEVMQKLQQNQYLLFIVTNQGGIAKGLYNHEDVRKLHHHLTEKLKENQVRITEIIFCPHHDQFNKCLCRKPGSLMVEKLLAKYGVDPAKSLMIGDRQRDIEAAEKAGVRGIKVESNEDLRNLQQLN